MDWRALYKYVTAKMVCEQQPRCYTMVATNCTTAPVSPQSQTAVSFCFVDIVFLKAPPQVSGE